MAHAAAVAAGLYTHNMMMPMTSAFWVTALVWRAGRAQWRWLATAHVLAGLAYAPWMMRLWQQASGESHLWIAELVRNDSGLDLVWATLKAFTIGGPLPDYLAFPVPRGGTSLALLVFLGAVLAAFWTAARGARDRGAAVHGRSVAVLLIFIAWPILFLLAYSSAIQPLYVAARYDLPGLPAYLLLCAVGLDALTLSFQRRGRAAGLLVPAAVVLLIAIVLEPKVMLPNLNEQEMASSRLANALERWAQPNDALIALDFTEPLATYAVFLSGMPVHVRRFPQTALHHLDEHTFNHRVASSQSAFRQEADALAAMFQGRRIWLIQGSFYATGAATGYERLRLLLTNELHRHRPAHGEAATFLRAMSMDLLEPQ
jgi:hypothetical protein